MNDNRTADAYDPEHLDLHLCDLFPFYPDPNADCIAEHVGLPVIGEAYMCYIETDLARRSADLEFRIPTSITHKKIKRSAIAQRDVFRFPSMATSGGKKSNHDATTSRSVSHLKELIGFLKDSRVDVRRRALAELKGFTGDDAGKAMLKNTKAYEHLPPSIFAPEVGEATEALTSAINLSEDEEIAKWFISSPAGVVTKIIDHITEKDTPISSLYLMLLANLTHWPEGCKKFLQIGEGKREGIYVAKILVRLINAIKRVEQSSLVRTDESLIWQAQIIQNVSQLAEGRKLFAERGKGLVSRLLPLLPSLRFPSHLVCRRSVLGLIRNCAFEEEALEWLIKEQQLMTVLAVPLLRPGTTSKFVAEDTQGMPVALSAAILSVDKETAYCEHDRSCQKLILESLLLLAKSRVVRNYYRTHKLYPVLREFHAVEGEALDEATVETIGKLVECCVCDEEPETKEKETKSSSSATSSSTPATTTPAPSVSTLPKAATSDPIEVKNVLHLPSSSTSSSSKKTTAAPIDSDDEEPQVEEIV